MNEPDWAGIAPFAKPPLSQNQPAVQNRAQPGSRRPHAEGGRGAQAPQLRAGADHRQSLRGTGADHRHAARHVRGSGRKKVERKTKNRQTEQEMEKLLIQRTHHIFKATKIGEIDTYQHCIFQIFKSTQNRQIGALDLGVGGKLTKQCKVGTQPIYNEADSDGVDDNQQVDSE
jgi:hypothetical protein